MKLITTFGIVLGALAVLPLRTAQAQDANDAQRELVAAHFLEADADGDGALSRREFAKLIDLNAQHDIGRARLIARFDGYGMAFGRADANADGGVTREELSSLAADHR